MGRRPPPEPSDPYIAELIEFKVRKLELHPSMTNCETEDLRQELALQVIKGMRRYDPKRSCPHTFADRIVSSKCITILQAAGAQRRDHRRERSLSEAAGVAARENGDAATAIDVRAAFSSLPPELQSIATLFGTDSDAKIARSTGCSRQHIRTARKKIQEHFRACGLEPEKELSTLQPLRKRTRYISGRSAKTRAGQEKRP